MKITVQTKPCAKNEEVIQMDQTHFKVSVKEPPIEGRANEGVCRLIAEYFDIAPSNVTVVSGHTSKKKILEIL